MKFTLTIACDNEYFADNYHEAVATLLRSTADRVEQGVGRMTVLDGNGNKVGIAEFIDGE